MAYRGRYVITKRQTRFYTLSIICAVCLSLLALISSSVGVSSYIGSVVGAILSPVSYATTELVDTVIGVKDYFSDIKELKKENLRLLAENDALRKEQARTASVLSENEELYAFLGLKKEFTDLVLVNAKITSKSNSGFMTSFTINKGTLHGVGKDMPIIADSGILGIVIEEGLATSRCISLVSHNSSAGVYILRTGIPGILEGDYALSADGMCKITGLSADSDVVVGDYVYTSGYGEIFPKDLCVGTVSEIIKDATTHTLTLHVLPTCDPNSIDTVMVVTDFEGRYEDPSTDSTAK